MAGCYALVRQSCRERGGANEGEPRFHSPMKQEDLRAHLLAIKNDETGQALREFHRKFGEELHLVAWHYARYWAASPYDEANDIYQEVLFRIHRYATSCEIDDNPRGWIRAIMQNVARTFRQRQLKLLEE